MSDLIIRGINGIRDIANQGLNTNNPLDLLLDKDDNVYIRLSNSYYKINKDESISVTWNTLKGKPFDILDDGWFTVTEEFLNGDTTTPYLTLSLVDKVKQDIEKIQTIVSDLDALDTQVTTNTNDITDLKERVKTLPWFPIFNIINIDNGKRINLYIPRYSIESANNLVVYIYYNDGTEDTVSNSISDFTLAYDSEGGDSDIISCQNLSNVQRINQIRILNKAVSPYLQIAGGVFYEVNEI